MIKINKKKILVVFAVITAIAAIYFVSQLYRKYEEQKIIAYYNDINNFKEFAVEGAEDFKLEDYHVSPPNYIKTKKLVSKKLKEDLLKLHPTGSDYRALIYTLLKNDMTTTYHKRNLYYIEFSNINKIKNNNKILHLYYEKYIDIKNVQDQQWHRYLIDISVNSEQSIFKINGGLDYGNTKEDIFAKYMQ